MTRSLGDLELKSQGVSNLPTVAKITINRKSDKYLQITIIDDLDKSNNPIGETKICTDLRLIVASDGLWDVLKDEDIKDVLYKN